jgi:hypothetical protein
VQAELDLFRHQYGFLALEVLGMFFRSRCRHQTPFQRPYCHASTTAWPSRPPYPVCPLHVSYMRNTALKDAERAQDNDLHT